MAVEPPCLAEEVVSALVVHLLRSGIVSEADLLAAAETAEAKQHIEALIVEAAAPPKPYLRAIK